MSDDGDGLQYQFPYSNRTDYRIPEGSYLCVTGWDISFPDSHVCSALQLLRCASKAGRKAGKAFGRGVLGRLCGVCFS